MEIWIEEILILSKARKLILENHIAIEISKTNNNSNIKGTVIQIEKALINDLLRVSKVSWKFRFATVYNFAVIFP